MTHRSLVLLLPLMMAWSFLSMLGSIGHLCKRCRCSCKNCLMGWLIIALAPLLAIAAVLFGYGSIANVVLINFATIKTDRCQLSPIEGYLPILLMFLLSGSVVNFLTNYGSEEDKPFTSVYFDKTVALWDHVVLVKKLPCHGQDIDVRVTEKPQSPFLVIEYLQSKTESISHYQYILTAFGFIGAQGHALIPGIFRMIDGQGFACGSSDPIVYWTVIINVVVSFVAIIGLTALLAALVEKALDAQQQVTLVGALISSSMASKYGLDRWLGITTRRNLLGWMLVRDYIVKSFRANSKNDAEVINPLVLYMIIMMLIVFIHLITTGVIDILVVVGLWDVCFLALFVMGFLFPALFTNTILKVDHPRAVRQVRWTVKKQLNDAQSLKTKSLQKFKPTIYEKEQRTLNKIEARILTQQNHMQLLDGALVELKEADVEVKILGFPVTESLLANMATLIGTGVSAISAKLSQSST
uniref:Uncharacterized protein n=1 Tax=Lotharella oceanica TaxID=641309 RepID=A0A7S2TJ19_9EUKA|mmetsp:Transcript_14792/g.28115  ORF Transcript_14792/g.28115 Transcript_14792/m.28115 type:complete len:469 (+) Transcript_14792:103-1509(+)